MIGKEMKGGKLVVRSPRRIVRVVLIKPSGSHTSESQDPEM